MDTTHNFYDRVQKSGNYLIVKDDVGKAKPTVRQLPPQDFAYGKKVVPDAMGAGGLLSSWDISLQSQRMGGDKDFKKLNALSIRKGCTTAAQQRQFRRTRNLRLQSAEPRGVDRLPDIVFGEHTRPSTPFHAVLGNFYGTFASDVKHSQYEHIPSTMTAREPRQTKWSTMMKNQKYEEAAVKREFKMKKFLKTQPRTNTRRPKFE